MKSYKVKGNTVVLSAPLIKTVYLGFHQHEGAIEMKCTFKSSFPCIFPWSIFCFQGNQHLLPIKLINTVPWGPG